MPKPNRPRVARTVRNADNRIEALTAQFTEQLNQILMRAQARTFDVLRTSLTFDASGKIARTAANRRALQGIAPAFENEMRGAGYPALVQTYLNQWPGMLPLFQDTLNAVTENWIEPPPPITWTPHDLQLMTKHAVRSGLELHQVVSLMGAEAQTKALFSVGALDFSKLTVAIAQSTGQTLPQARTLAATATTNYYRTIADLGFRQIEDGRPGEQIRYTYEGPDDVLTRPFCQRVLHSNRPFTREEINAMEDWKGHSLPNVMTSCGGYNCRHQWILWIDRSKRKPPARQRGN